MDKKPSSLTKKVSKPSAPCAKTCSSGISKPPAKTLKKETVACKKPSSLNAKKTENTTKVYIQYDVGFDNTLYIRGKGAGLSWNNGIQLKNIDANEWIWETDRQFSTCEFKVLINDSQYEVGSNHSISCGSEMTYNPVF